MKLENIVSQLFIEHWINTTNFSSYYYQCAPYECSYSYEERFNRAYIVATIFGVIGGLSAALQILIPIIIKLIGGIYHHCSKRSYAIRREVIFNISIRQKYLNLLTYVQTLNLYKNRHRNHSPTPSTITSDNISLIQRQRVATRYLVILFIIVFITIFTYTAFHLSTYSVGISTPSESIFEFLQNKYPYTLSCPCTQVAISFSKFLTIEPSEYHQICSSYFISSDFFRTLWGSNEMNAYFTYLDGKILSTEFRLLSRLCSLAKNIIEQKIEILSTREFITFETLSKESFQHQVDSIINSFIMETPSHFRRTHRYIIDILHANQLQNIFAINWKLGTVTAQNNYILSTIPVSVEQNGRTCSCNTLSTCSRSELRQEKKQARFAGLVIGCLPGYGLRLSTLECFYNSTCLKRLGDFVNSTYVFAPLNISIKSRFTPISSTTIDILIDKLFIESWKNTSNYSSYYSTCAPFTCRYTYVERNNILYTLTTFLGLYGGLIEGLRSFVWYGLYLFWKVRHWLKYRRSVIVPVNSNE